MQKELGAIFEQTAREAYDAFPRQLRTLFLFMTDAKTPVYLAPATAAKLSSATQEVSRVIARETAYIKRRNCVGMAYHPMRVAGHMVKMIGVHSDVSGVFNKRYTKDMRSVYVLDHEIGHQVVPRGMVSGYLAECRADAFATLRHLQRYGFDTDYFVLMTRAHSVVLGTSPVHYTTDIMEAVRAYARDNDISGLPLAATARLADRLVRSLPVGSADIHRLAKKFRPAARMAVRHCGGKKELVDALYDRDHDAYEVFCRETASVMRAHPADARVISAGQRFLNFPPVHDFITARAKADPAWRRIADLSKAPTPAMKKHGA